MIDVMARTGELLLVLHEKTVEEYTHGMELWLKAGPPYQFLVHDPNVSLDETRSRIATHLDLPINDVELELFVPTNGPIDPDIPF